MSLRSETYTTKELTRKTWPDFERFFSQGNGWDFCWCMHFQPPRTLPRNKWRLTRAERGVRNHREKKELVKEGRAHGILVYANGEPVGWCQYGPQEELPRIDNERNYRALAAEDRAKELGRITCFVTDKKHRRSGVATAALKAALEAIRKKGGSLVEVYPIIPWEELCRARVRRVTAGPAKSSNSFAVYCRDKDLGWILLKPRWARAYLPLREPIHSATKLCFASAKLLPRAVSRRSLQRFSLMSYANSFASSTLP